MSERPHLGDRPRASAGRLDCEERVTGAERLPISGHVVVPCVEFIVAMGDMNVGDGFLERVSPEHLRQGLFRDHVARYLFAAHFVSGSSVVDLCCGVGYGSNLLAAAGARRVTGVDIDAPAITTAREHYEAPEFLVARADEPSDLSGFDVAVCMEGIEHVTNPDQLLANMRCAEVAFVSTPNAAYYEGGFSGNPHHVNEWTKDEFETMLSRHFSEVRMYFQWKDPDPLDQNWGLRTAAKAVLPISLKSRLRTPPVDEQHTQNAPRASPLSRMDYRVYPANYLTLLPPGLRYSKPWVWLAVCVS